MTTTPAPARGRPGRTVLAGARVRLEPLDPARHAADLFAAARRATRRCGTTSPTARSPTSAALTEHLRAQAASEDPLLLRGRRRRRRARASSASCASSPRTGASRSATSGSARRCSARPRPPRRSTCSRARRSTGSATAAWSGSATPPTTRSRRAAERFGFTFEGVFRQHMIVKGANRDTAWYSILDGEWPAVRAGFEAWLDAGELRRRRPPARARWRQFVGSEEPAKPKNQIAERDQREADRDDHHLVEHAAAAGRGALGAHRAQPGRAMALLVAAGQAPVQPVQVAEELADDRHPDRAGRSAPAGTGRRSGCDESATREAR